MRDEVVEFFKLFVISLFVVIYILFNKYTFIIKKDGFIYNIYHSNTLFEKDLLGNIKAFCIILYMAYIFIMLSFLIDHLIFMNPQSSGGSGSGGGMYNNPGAGGNPNPTPNSNNNIDPSSVTRNQDDRYKFSHIMSEAPTATTAPVVPNTVQSNTYIGEALSGRIIYKTDADGKDYLIVEPDSGSNIDMLNQLKRGALSGCEIKTASIMRKGEKTMFALDLGSVPRRYDTINNFNGVIIPNIFNEDDYITSNFNRPIRTYDEGTVFITGDKVKKIK